MSKSNRESKVELTVVYIDYIRLAGHCNAQFWSSAFGCKLPSICIRVFGESNRERELFPPKWTAARFIWTHRHKLGRVVSITDERNKDEDLSFFFLFLFLYRILR